MVEDLEIISSIFPILYQKLYILHNKNLKVSDVTKTLPNTNTEEINLITISKTDVEATKSIMDISQKVDVEGDKVQSLAVISNLGNLIPVTCGHNGNLSKNERALFDYHLKNSGFILNHNS